MQKHTFTLLIIIVIGASSFAQKVKYKDLYPVIAGRQYNDDILLTKLKEYKRLSPEEGNQYYQMGKLYYRRIEKFDVLKQLNGALQVVDSGLYYFQKAKEVIDEKEVKRKEEYYVDFLTSPTGQKREEVTIQHVNDDIAYMVEKLKTHRDNIIKINEHFNATVDNYYAANDLFTEIYKEYSTYKEMCLLADDSFMNRMAKMNEHFDKAIENFDLYKNDIQKFPIKGYNQDYELHEILNYRLHGLTKANFLADKVNLWNYGEWYDQTIAFINNEIKPLREIIIEDEKDLNRRIEEISNSTVPLESDFRIESDVLLLIKKYDPASFLVDIFRYKESKINLINSQILELDSTDFISRARSMANSIIHARSSISALDKAREDVSEHLIARHKSFFNVYYGGDPESYIKQERQKVSPILRNSLDLLKNELVKELALDSGSAKVAINSNGDKRIYLTVNDGKIEATKGDYITLDVFDHKNKSYVSGYVENNDGRNAFVAYVVNDTLKWLNSPKISEPYSESTAIVSIGNGCAISVYSYDSLQQDSVTTSLIEFTNEGKELISNKLKLNAIPHEIAYSEDDNTFVSLFGPVNDREQGSLLSYDLVKIDQEGQILWEANIEFNGEVQSLIPYNNGYLLTANVKEAVGRNNELLKSENGLSNVFLAYFSSNGVLRSSYFADANLSNYASHIINDLDEEIIIMGFEGEISKWDGNEELMLIWLDEDLELIDTTLE